MYSFRRIKKDYKDMLLVCVCTSEEKIWVIPYNNLCLKEQNLNISERSKYNEYKCDNNLILNQYIDKYKNECMRLPLNKCMLPVSDLQQREQEYAKKRENTIDFLQFNKMNIQNTPTDFIVNNKKVQEKVCGYDKSHNSLVAHLASNNGKTNTGARQFRTYQIGENDYYWFNSSIDNRFWIVPEKILYDKGYISEKDSIKKNKVLRILVNPENNYGVREWIKEYEYNYDNPDREKITKLFE